MILHRSHNAIVQTFLDTRKLVTALNFKNIFLFRNRLSHIKTLVYIEIHDI